MMQFLSAFVRPLRTLGDEGYIEIAAEKAFFSILETIFAKIRMLITWVTLPGMSNPTNLPGISLKIRNRESDK